tara:strand:- start:961 stop:1203 length:243 start_codon:yes stop_codon:yes gene_type:complete
MDVGAVSKVNVLFQFHIFGYGDQKEAVVEKEFFQFKENTAAFFLNFPNFKTKKCATQPRSRINLMKPFFGFYLPFFISIA